MRDLRVSILKLGILWQACKQNQLIQIKGRPHQSVGGRLYEFGVKKNWFLTVKKVVSV